MCLKYQSVIHWSSGTLKNTVNAVSGIGWVVFTTAVHTSINGSNLHIRGTSFDITRCILLT